MKKIMTLFFVAVAAFSLAACGGKDYANDGVFTAFDVDGTTITWVDVTIEKGKVKSYFIDARQSTLSVVEGKAVINWNEKTKKELQYDYRMHDGARTMTAEEYKKHLKDNNLKEWFEQAELIEKHFLEKDLNLSMTNNKIDNVSGVTIKDSSYSKLAKAALDNAKNNVTYALDITGTTFTTVKYTVDKKGKAVSYYIDALQATLSVVEGKANLKWNEKTKKELQYDYRMHDGAKTMTAEEYKKHLKDNNLKEWFEQAELIEKHFIEKDLNLTVTNEKIDNVAGVTIKDGNYSKLAKAAKAKIK